MRFDDRLRTVLDQPVGDAHDRAVRWRQLVDLLARSGTAAETPYCRIAFDLVREDRAYVDDQLRAAAARAIAAFPLSYELIALFASDRLKVSAPILAAANLRVEQWRTLLEAADEETGAFVRALHPEVDRRSASRTDRRATPSEPAGPSPSISDVIARIERMREAREQGEPVAHREPVADFALGEKSALFRWECNGDGEFAWVEGAPRGALIGRALVNPAHLRDYGNDEIARAFSLRAPFRNAVITLEPETPLGGVWQVSGMPAFEHPSGRFAGYRGVARRAGAPERQVEAPQPDSLRELVHEIKTPLNAIMGFAEIIETQMFGPADSRYRARAAEIVTQAHLLLAAIDDLDFAAKSRSGGFVRTHIGQLVESMMPELRQLASLRRVEVEASRTTRDLAAAVDAALAERLIMRLCSGVLERAGEGERLRLLVDQNDDHCRVSISRPAVLSGLTDQELLGEGRGLLAENLWLRLARGLAQVAGADLVTSGDAIALKFPSASLGGADGHGYGTRTGQGL